MTNLTQSVQNSTAPKLDMKMMRDLLDLQAKAKANDTEGALMALLNLREDLVASSASADQHGKNYFDKSAMQNRTTGFNFTTEGEDGSFEWSSLLEGLNGTENETELSSNWTDVAYNGTGAIWEGLMNISSWKSRGDGDDLSSGLDMKSILDYTMTNTEDGVPEAPTTHSGFLCTLANLVMITFIYYIPRILYYRIIRCGIDSKQPCFFLILFLTLIVVAGAVIHMLSFYDAITRIPILALFISPVTEEVDMYTPFVYKSLVTSINRVVSPIIAIFCIQQIAMHAQFRVDLLQKSITQALLCIAVTTVVFGYTFFVETEVLEMMEEKIANNTKFFFLNTPTYPDRSNIDLFDVVPPFLTGALFFFARSKVTRTSTYSSDNSSPLDPTHLDRVSKVVMFQLIMATLAIVSFVLRGPEDGTDSFYTFLIAAQTPAVHWVLFRSMLRSRKPTRLCFLCCCNSEEKVSAVDGAAGNANKHPDTNEPSQKNDDDDDEEEETQETLDHNKIILVRASQANEERAGDDEMKH